MSHIVIDGRMIAWTGIGRYTQRLLENLEEIDKKNEYTILVLKSDAHRWQPTAKNFRVKVINIVPYDVTAQWRLPAILKSLTPSLVHFPAPITPLFYRGRHITTIHDLTLIDYKNIRGGNAWQYEIKYQLFKVIITNAAKRSARVISGTHFVAGQIVKRLGAKNTNVKAISLAAESPAVKIKPYNLMEHKKYVLCVGNAFPYKNLVRLCDASAKLGKPDLHLVLVGKKDYFYAELQKYIDHRGYKNIHLTGFVSDEQLAWLYKTSQAYIFPSLSEGFGLPGLEAMQYGAPVVSSNATCLPEVYGDAAAYFDPLDTEDMARVMGEVLESKKLQGQLRKKGFARVKQFSWRKTAEQTLAVYEEALQEGQ